MTNEDIKIVEKLIDDCVKCKFAACEQCEINWKQIQVIQKLLDEYNTQQKISQNVISKNKIKAEIKELEDNGYWYYLEYSDLKRTIKLLEDLSK